MSLLCPLFCTIGGSDNEHSILPKRKLDELVDTPTSRSSGGDVDGFFASPDGSSGGSGGYKARDMAARAGGGGALTPVIKRRAILRGDRSPPEHEASFVETEAAAAAASALLAVRSSDGPKRYIFWDSVCSVLCTCAVPCILYTWYSFS